MENGKIPESSITASSQYNNATGPENSRLNFKGVKETDGGWRSNVGDRKPWFQVDFASLMNITGFATLGMADEKRRLAETYTLSYSDDGVIFHRYLGNKVSDIFVLFLLNSHLFYLLIDGIKM